MKKLKAVMLLVLCVFVVSSCSKSTIDVNSLNVISFKLDGTAKSTVSVVGTLITKTNTLQIIGAMATGEVIGITVDNAHVGSYDVTANTAILYYGTNSTYQSTYLASSGTVTITAISATSVTGYFSFVGANTSNTTSTKTVTEGNFKCAVTSM